MDKICRTCLTRIEPKDSYYNINSKDTTSISFLIQTKLKSCVPEISQDLIANSIMCTKCLHKLETAYTFKTKCLEVEVRIHEYFKSPADLYSNSVILYELVKTLVEKDVATISVSENRKRFSTSKEDHVPTKQMCLNSPNNEAGSSTLTKMANNLNFDEVSIVAVSKTASPIPSSKGLSVESYKNTNTDAKVYIVDSDSDNEETKSSRISKVRRRLSTEFIDVNTISTKSCSPSSAKTTCTTHKGTSQPVVDVDSVSLHLVPKTTSTVTNNDNEPVYSRGVMLNPNVQIYSKPTVSKSSCESIFSITPVSKRNNSPATTQPTQTANKTIYVSRTHLQTSITSKNASISISPTVQLHTSAIANSKTRESPAAPTLVSETHLQMPTINKTTSVTNSNIPNHTTATANSRTRESLAARTVSENNALQTHSQITPITNKTVFVSTSPTVQLHKSPIANSRTRKSPAAPTLVSETHSQMPTINKTMSVTNSNVPNHTNATANSKTRESLAARTVSENNALKTYSQITQITNKPVSVSTTPMVQLRTSASGNSGAKESLAAQTVSENNAFQTSQITPITNKIVSVSTSPMLQNHISAIANSRTRESLTARIPLLENIAFQTHSQIIPTINKITSVTNPSVPNHTNTITNSGTRESITALNCVSEKRTFQMYVHPKSATSVLENPIVQIRTSTAATKSVSNYVPTAGNDFSQTTLGHHESSNSPIYSGISFLTIDNKKKTLRDNLTNTSASTAGSKQNLNNFMVTKSLPVVTTTYSAAPIKLTEIDAASFLKLARCHAALKPVDVADIKNAEIILLKDPASTNYAITNHTNGIITTCSTSIINENIPVLDSVVSSNYGNTSQPTVNQLAVTSSSNVAMSSPNLPAVSTSVIKHYVDLTVDPNMNSKQKDEDAISIVPMLDNPSVYNIIQPSKVSISAPPPLVRRNDNCRVAILSNNFKKSIFVARTNSSLTVNNATAKLVLSPVNDAVKSVVNDTAAQSTCEIPTSNVLTTPSCTANDGLKDHTSQGRKFLQLKSPNELLKIPLSKLVIRNSSVPLVLTPVKSLSSVDEIDKTNTQTIPSDPFVFKAPAPPKAILATKSDVKNNSVKHNKFCNEPKVKPAKSRGKITVRKHSISQFKIGEMLALMFRCSVRLPKITPLKLLEAIRAKYLCNFCGFKSMKSQDLTDHLKSVHSDKIYACCICKYVTTDVNTFDLHVENVHVCHFEYNDPTETNYTCKKCKFSTKKRMNMVIHNKFHSNRNMPGLYNCDSCSYTLDTKEDFQKHLSAHGNQVYYFCTICVSIYANRKIFKQHIMDHSPVVRKCLQCKFQSTIFEDLRNHYLDKHFVKSPFVCVHCNGVYKLRIALLKHVLSFKFENISIKEQIYSEHSYSCNYVAY